MPALPDKLPSSRGTPAAHTGEGGVGTLIDPTSFVAAKADPMLRMAGGLSFAAVLIGLSLFVLTCAGFDAALQFSPAVLGLATGSGVMTLIASNRYPRPQSSAILASLFLCILATLGGLLELAVWLQWPILFSQQR